MIKSIDEILEGLSSEDRAIIQRELSEQRKIEESMQEAHSIINKSPSVAFTWRNSDGWPVEFVTENVKKLFGYTVEELKSGNVPYIRCVHPDDLERVAEEVSQFSSEEGRSDFVHKPYRIVTKDGLEKIVDDKTSIVRDEEGNVTHYQGILTDITKRKKAEDALRETNERLELVLEGGDIGYWDWNIKTGKCVFDERWQGMLGYSNGDIEQNVDTWQNLLHPDDASRVESVLDAHHKDKNVVYSPEFRLKTKSEGYKWIHAMGKVVEWDEDGSPLRMAGTHLDITDRKQAEKAVIKSERLSAIGELASGVAHDFNNSLQGIFGNIELALLEDSSPEVRDYLETIKKSASDAASRIQQLQRFAGKRNESLEYQVIDFNSIVDDAIAQTRNLWKDEAQKNGLDIAVNTHYGDDISVLGNQGELRSVLYNLIKNSVQAMPDGGTIDVSTRREGEKAYLTLTDTGEGMDEETKTRIFQPFYTTKGFEQGKGLGMAGSYSIITEHKGQIYVKRTALGKGTSIEIAIPYTERETAPEKDTARGYDGSARVLWVDDEEMIRDMGKSLLETMGHEADVASGGQEALELLASKEYDLMITDVGMPNMSGWQLAERIKGQYSGMKVAVVTGWGNDVEPEQKKQYGVGYVLGKPVEMKQLKNLVGEVLQMKSK